MHDSPLVSIIIPVYNGANFMRAAIDSALAQSYPHVEVLVINDGSRDEGATDTIARSYGERIRYFSKPNGGVASALNLGVREMKGAYFSWLSHDDVYPPDKLERQVAFLGGQPPNTIVYGDFDMIDAESRHTGSVRLPDTPPAAFYFALLKSSFLHGCSLLIPRICFETCGTFDEKLRTAQDYDLWFRMALKYPFVHQPGLAVFSRIHEGQDTRKLPDVVITECNGIFVRHLSRLPLEETAVATGLSPAEIFLQLAAGMRARGFFECAEDCIRRARKETDKLPLFQKIRFRLQQHWLRWRAGRLRYGYWRDLATGRRHHT
nr:glycosyltransferase [Oscillatoria laete-virens]